MNRSSFVRTTLTIVAVALLIATAIQAMAQTPATGAFEDTWARTDLPVQDGTVSHTWMWGPGPFTDGMMEPYQESPDGERLVQYYDKSRMELTQPDAPNDSPWYVTNGLLVLEMVEGYVQVGDSATEPAPVSQIPVAGDADHATAPTYATVAELLDLPARSEGAPITEIVHRDGTVEDDPSLADHGVTTTVSAAEYGRDHRVASVFLDFMQQRGPVHVDGEIVEARLFFNDYYATGLPIAEAYWAKVSVAGTEKLVLFQCFERRCLTYTSDNPDGWKVEAGNVGQHYYAWRYERAEPDPTSTVPAGSDDPSDPTATSTPGDDAGATATSTEEDSGDNATETPTPADGSSDSTATPTATSPSDGGSDPTATATPLPTETPIATSTATNTPTATATPSPTQSPTATEDDSGSSDGPTNPSSAAICLNGTESAFLTLINDYRQQNGLDPLAASRTLNVASYYHSLDMSKNGYFDHTGQDGDSPWDRMEEAGYDYNTTKAENIAHGYGSAQAVFDGWRNSSGHNANMLSSSLNVIGIGYVSDGSYWTTDFGGHVDAAPGC